MDGSGPSTLRTRIFVDFWNFQLSVNQTANNFTIDWRKLPGCLVEAANELAGAKERKLLYEGMGVYLSYDPSKESDKKLTNWARSFLSKGPGVDVSIVQRKKKKSHPKCPVCHATVEACPSCSEDMRGTQEKGVDTRIVTDMIRLAWEGTYDVAVLLSSDADFVPAVEFLRDKNLKIIHGGFPKLGSHLGEECWGQICLPDIMKNFSR